MTRAGGLGAAGWVTAGLLALLVVDASLLSARPGSGDDPADGALGFTPRQLAEILDLSPLGVPPPDRTNRVADDPRAAQLGQFLFFDTRLSAEGDRSCATCHVPERSFADGLPLARGRAELRRHTPALWNLAWNRWYFWDGRADSLWAQALAPIESPEELGFTRHRLLALFHDDEELSAAYAAIFGPLPPRPAASRLTADVAEARRFMEAGPAREAAAAVLSAPAEPGRSEFIPFGTEPPPQPIPAPPEPVDVFFANVGKSLAAYQRRLVSADAPFDRFVQGLRDGDPEKLDALSEPARRGLSLFTGRGRCVLCHSGPNFTDLEFHSVRIPPLREDLARDPGRHHGVVAVLNDPFNVKGPHSDDRGPDAADKLDYLVQALDLFGSFKTPSLRNVARTAPYMHQGQVATLREVIEHYSRFERVHDPLPNHFELTLQPLEFSEREVDDLLAFLESLTDEKLDPGLLSQPPGPR